MEKPLKHQRRLGLHCDKGVPVIEVRLYIFVFHFIFSFSSLLCDLNQRWDEELRSYWKAIIWLVESQGHRSSPVYLYQLFKLCKRTMLILIPDIDVT